MCNVTIPCLRDNQLKTQTKRSGIPLLHKDKDILSTVEGIMNQVRSYMCMLCDALKASSVMILPHFEISPRFVQEAHKTVME